jgi:hypothetical protein
MQAALNQHFKQSVKAGMALCRSGNACPVSLVEHAFGLNKAWASRLDCVSGLGVVIGGRGRSRSLI